MKLFINQILEEFQNLGTEFLKLDLQTKILTALIYLIITFFTVIIGIFIGMILSLLLF